MRLGAKTHAIDIEFEAFAFDVVVAFSRIISINELAMAIDANVILFASSLTILTDVG